MMSTPRTRCPAIHARGIELAPTTELEPIAEHLSSAQHVKTTRTFPRGTVVEDGRLDFCKQGLGPEGLSIVLDALGPAHPFLRHILLGTNAIGDEGARRIGDRLSSGL